MDYPVFSQNGRILPREQATVSLFSIEYAYGFGVYENIRAHEGIAYFLDAHAARLLRSAEIVGVCHPFSAEECARWVRAIVEAVHEKDFNIKLLLIGAPDPKDATLSILPLAPSYPKDAWFRDGVAVQSVRYERLFPNAKTLNMLGSYLAYTQARAADCYDALLVDRDGNATEGTRTNLFAVRGDMLVGPPAGTILEGVSRRILLRVAPEAGVQVEERLLPLEEMRTFDGALLTSTSSKVMPVRSIDAWNYPDIPPVVRRLQAAFDRFVRESGGTL